MENDTELMLSLIHISASMAAAGANVVLNFIFIRLFGYIAAGYTTLACYMLYLSLIHIYRCQPIDPTTEIRKSHRQIHLFKSGTCISAGTLPMIRIKNTRGLSAEIFSGTSLEMPVSYTHLGYRRSDSLTDRALLVLLLKYWYSCNFSFSN